MAKAGSARAAVVLRASAARAAVLVGASALAVASLARGDTAEPARRAGDAAAQVPGAAHQLVVGDLPRPSATPSVDHQPRIVPRPTNAWPQVPAGFRVTLYADGLDNPRALRTAPNGDVFVTESRAGRLRVLRGVGPDGRAKGGATFVQHLTRPFGVAFYPPGPSPEWLYVANTGSIVRFRYVNGDLRARRTPPERIATLPGGGLLRGGGHWTRDLAFSADGKKLYVSVGSRSNVDDTDGNADERERADILEMSPEGKDRRIYASGLRNAVGIAISPRTGALWASVNERDELGDELVPDYVTHVVDGGFYGWPWFYLGAHEDPRRAGEHPELAHRALVPDVLLPSHSASLALAFYGGEQFPVAYRGDIFAAQHGSWNRATPAGYEVVRVRLDEQGNARGGYEDFMTGFVTPDGAAWGRPVGVAVAADGALLVSDDAGNCVWRVEAKAR
ncbi:MAG: L-sorbosone dehydrogenase [Myxococcales bacterium]|nr:L-sorbosone dehydrogenase [Myxococcales bacterium]